MTARCKIHSLVLFVLAISLMAGIASSQAYADTIYSYTGNAFTTLAAGYTCPPLCSVTGSFTVAQPLAPNLAFLTAVTPESFSLTAGGVTLTDGVPADTQLAVSTNASGQIVGWNFLVVGPANNPTARILTQNDPTNSSFTVDDVRFGNNPPPFVGPVVGINSGNPGTWSSSVSVPEPSSWPMLGITAVGVLGAIKKKFLTVR